jgi:TonB family protein
MRSSLLSLLIGIVLIPLAAGGCSNVNVEAKDESQPPHEQIFREEMEGRSADYTRPRVLELPEVAYPAEAAELDLSGLVMIRVLVGYDGQVAEAEVMQGLHPVVDTAALEAARGGRYAPATQSGIATDDWVTIPFRYPPPAMEAD